MSRKKIENSERKGVSAKVFSRAVDALKRGEVIVFPTETFYGLGADAFNETAVEQVVFLKGRSPESPIPIIIADEKMLKRVVRDLPPIAVRLIDHFWPGPLTLVLPATEGLPEALLNKDGGVGVRVSSHPVATQLSRELNRPLTATSANPSGKEPARTVDEARTYFADRVEIFLDGGRLEGKKGSTVVAIREGEWRIIREGAISHQELEKV